MLKRILFILFTLFAFGGISLFAQSDEKVEKVEKEKKKKKKDAVDSSITIKEVVTEKVAPIKGSAKKWMKKGDQFYKEGANFAAIENYEIALNKTKKKKLRKSLFYKMGESAYAVRDYVLAESYYKSCMAIETKKNKQPLVRFQYANTLKYQVKYRKASDVYGEFVQEIGDNEKYANEKVKARLEAKGCDYALNISPKKFEFLVENAGEDVNGEFADFGPDIRDNELVFSKILKNTEEGQANGSDHAKIYTSEMYDDKFNFAQKFSSVLNQGEEFVCNPSFTADNKTVYFTKCAMDKKMGTQCSIYRSSIENGVWSEPKLLDANINAKESSNSHPQISQDENGKTFLYFSSNREGGRGGKDIWMAAKKDDGTFARAKNLGSKINSRFDEVSPFYVSKTNDLYFSTDGKISFGGLDIYKSNKSEDGWSDAEIMPYPINSSVDDYDFVMDEGGEFGFLVSNRIGTTSKKGATCCDDIFIWRNVNINIFLKGLVYAENAKKRELVKTATVSLKNMETGNIDSLTFNGDNFIIKLEKDVEYELITENKDFKPTGITLNTNNIVRSDTLQYDIFFKEKKQVSFVNKLIGTIYYEYNLARLTKEAPKTLVEIVTFLKKNPKTTVEISAHTDDKGAAEYNLDLSQERCLAAANYLDFHGITSDRIVLKWFGETKPIAPNTNKDGSDNPEGRSLNRRTEFKIVE